MLLGFALHFGNATTFREASRDPWNPSDRLACLRRPLDERTDRCVALPASKARCGAPVILISLRSLRAVAASVCDRGPRRALVDLTRPLARALGSRGREPVALLVRR